jgi:tetratricopeptide (TPR) repeat protein
MFIFSKRFLYALSNKLRRINSAKKTNDLLILDFTKPENSPFIIKPDSWYNAYLSGNSLFLGLKKHNFIAWVDTPQEFQNHVIDAKIHLDSLGGYAATGILFHCQEDDTYCMALVSSKGYFRLDRVKEGVSKSLIGWTEVSGFDGNIIELKLIIYGSYIICVVNGKWLGEAVSDAITQGHTGFVLASYEAGNKDNSEYTCEAVLESFLVDARVDSIEINYNKWNNDSNINADCRLRLAETFAAMGDWSRAYEQIKRAWKRRAEVFGTVTGSFEEIRTRKELLLAARMAFRIGQYGESDELLDAILEMGSGFPENREAVNEKIKTLYELGMYEQLKLFALKYNKLIIKNVDYYSMLAACYWKLNEYKKSAVLWEKAFRLDGKNGVYAVNAASALELNGDKEDALKRYIIAGNIFIKEDNQGELGAMIPKLELLGVNSVDAHALIGKWAYSVDDYRRCDAEFSAAEKLRRKIKPRPKADPALCYLWGMVYNLQGKTKEAVRMLEEAVHLAPEYKLFSQKLAEVKSKKEA